MIKDTTKTKKTDVGAYMLRFFKRLFCKHEYRFAKSEFFNGGASKAFIYRCKKCGKVMIKIL